MKIHQNRTVVWTGAALVCVFLALSSGWAYAEKPSTKKIPTSPPCRKLLSADLPAKWVAHQIQILNKDNPQVRQLRAAAQNLGFSNVALNPEIVRRHTEHYSYTLPRGEISNQQGSGRCWIFAAANMLRSQMIKEGLVNTSFQFSHNYIWFYHFLEQTNRYLEKLITDRGKQFNPENLRDHLKFQPEEGGYFEYFSYLVNKYGLVPIEYMPDTAQSFYPGDLVDELTREINLIALEMENKIQKQRKSSAEKLRKDKNKDMARVFRILATHLGLPPIHFDFRIRKLEQPDTNHKVGQLVIEPAAIKTMTPLQFTREWVGFNSEDWVTLTANPLQEKDTHYRIRNSMIGVPGEETIDFHRHSLNISPEELEQMTLASLKAEIPVWTAVDISQDVDHETGIMHPEIYNRAAVYGPKYRQRDRQLTREAGVYSTFYAPRHAVLIYGVDFPNSASPHPIKFRVENSWGYWAGDWGEYHMYRDWFLKYNYEIVVHKKVLSPELQTLLKTKPENLDVKWSF